MVETPTPGAADAAPVVIDASVLKPSLTALVRWLATLLAATLVQRGLVSKGLGDQLVPVVVGLTLAAGTLGWSLVQKRVASHRTVLAALTPPTQVVLR